MGDQPHPHPQELTPLERKLVAAFLSAHKGYEINPESLSIHDNDVAAALSGVRTFAAQCLQLLESAKTRQELESAIESTEIHDDSTSLCLPEHLEKALIAAFLSNDLNYDVHPDSLSLQEPRLAKHLQVIRLVVETTEIMYCPEAYEQFDKALLDAHDPAKKFIALLRLLIPLAISLIAVILFTATFCTGLYYQQLYLDCPAWRLAVAENSEMNTLPAACPPRNFMLAAAILFPIQNLAFLLHLLVTSSLWPTEKFKVNCNFLKNARGPGHFVQNVIDSLIVVVAEKSVQFYSGPCQQPSPAMCYVDSFDEFKWLRCNINFLVY